MDMQVILDRVREHGKKLCIPALILLLGIVLMTLPEKKAAQGTAPTESIPEVKTDLQDDLEEILSLIQGAGKVRVLLTESEGTLTRFQMDTDTQKNGESSSTRQDTVLYTDDSRKEQGLVRQIIPPVYQGAVILCQGADSAQVRLSILQAVASATGLSTDKITVLKMK